MFNYFFLISVSWTKTCFCSHEIIILTNNLMQYGLAHEPLQSIFPFDFSLCYQRGSWIKLVMFLRGKPHSSEYISMELSPPEPSVSLHLAPQTWAALGTTAVTFHHSIKDFPVSCKATAGRGSGKYIFLFPFFLPILPSFMETLVCLHFKDYKNTNKFIKWSSNK